MKPAHALREGLKARISSMQKLAALFKDDLNARVASLQKQIDRATAAVDSSAPSASQLHSSLANCPAKLLQPELPAASLEELQRQLQASKELCSAQQQLAELKEELARERSGHAMTAAQEEQVTAALLAQQRYLSSAVTA
jgi:HPt (histidine-containing phosphotransfer) domain-containing protein